MIFLCTQLYIYTYIHPCSDLLQPLVELPTVFLDFSRRLLQHVDAQREGRVYQRGWAVCMSGSAVMCQSTQVGVEVRRPILFATASLSIHKCRRT